MSDNDAISIGQDVRGVAGRLAYPIALPPDAPLARARHGLDACVHCGFCLEACPTYLAVEDENDSPRGRLVLMRSIVEGALATDDPAARMHIDRCLGCRACETACPSGVPYGELLEATSGFRRTGGRRSLIPRSRAGFVGSYSNHLQPA